MVVFNTAYSPMDRQYSAANVRIPETTDPNKKPVMDGIEISNIGADINIGKDIISELKARIYAGVSKVELGFSGAGKGWRTQGQVTPEAYGKEEREAIRDLAEINKVKLSTHATVGVGAFSGISEGGFSDEQRIRAVNELKRAIDFAADVAKGGPVVCHVGEWQRPVSEAEKNLFEAFPGEKEKAKIYLVDEEDGRVQVISRDMKVPEPVIKGYDKNNNPIYEFDPETKLIKTEMKSFQEIVDEERKKNPDLKKTPEQIFLDHFYGTKIEEASFQAKRWATDYHEHKRELEKIDKALDFYRRIEEAATPEEREEMKREFGSDFGGLVPPDIKTPYEFLKEKRDIIAAQLKYSEEAARGFSKQITEIQHRINTTKPIEEYGLAKTAESLADAAIYAMKVEKKKNLERPIQIVPEEIFPETFGGHPDELKKIVLASRNRMVEKLKQDNIPESEARRIAEQKIGATFDVGHMNTWRKYFKGSKEEFNKWVLSKAEELAKEGIVTHVHVTDNFGYYDEHLAPGQGDAPVKEVLDIFKKYKIPEKGTLIVEGSGTTAEWQQAIEATSNPIYAAGPTMQQTRGYKAAVSRPYFVLHSYVPIEEHKPWTETPFE